MFLYRKGVPAGFLGQFLAMKGGGGSYAGRGSWGVRVALPLHILTSPFVACFYFKCNAKGCCRFPCQCRPCDPYWDLKGDARRHKQKYIRNVVGVVLGDDNIVVRTTGNSIVIESSSHEVRDDDEPHVSEEVIQVVRTAHHMSLSTRNMLRLERNCTRR